MMALAKLLAFCSDNIGPLIGFTVIEVRVLTGDARAVISGWLVVETVPYTRATRFGARDRVARLA